MLSYNTEAKSTWMDEMEWQEDSDFSFQPPASLLSNEGWKARRKLFLNEAETAFTDEWVQLTGRLCLDVESIKTGNVITNYSNAFLQ